MRLIFVAVGAAVATVLTAATLGVVLSEDSEPTVTDQEAFCSFGTQSNASRLVALAEQSPNLAGLRIAAAGYLRAAPALTRHEMRTVRDGIDAMTGPPPRVATAETLAAALAVDDYIHAHCPKPKD